MKAYKFLDDSGRTPFMGSTWSTDSWIETTTAEPCNQGVHACDLEHLANWLADRLWEVELDGDMATTTHKLVATRGRLVREIVGYPEAARELGAARAWAARDRVVETLRSNNELELAERFASVTTLQQLAALKDVTGDATFARVAAGFAADVADDTLNGTLAQGPFVACCLAGHLAAGEHGEEDVYEQGFDGERRSQSAWLAGRLALS